jgi:hypothetical protein
MGSKIIDRQFHEDRSVSSPPVKLEATYNRGSHIAEAILFLMRHHILIVSLAIINALA